MLRRGKFLFYFAFVSMFHKYEILKARVLKFILNNNINISICTQFLIIGKGASKGSTSSSVGNANIPQRKEPPFNSPLW